MISVRRSAAPRTADPARGFGNAHDHATRTGLDAAPHAKALCLRTPMELHAALMPVPEILRAEGIIARAPAPMGPIADELSRYVAYMSSALRLAAVTRWGRLRIVERLLLASLQGGPSP